MNSSPHTRPSLLVRLRDAADHDAWRQLVELYAPLVYRFLRKRGLQDADAADLTQDVLRSLAAAIDSFEYDPRRGSFRGWLFTVARNKLHTFLRKKKRRPTEDDEERLLREPAPDEDVELWEQEYRQRLFDWAADRVRGQFQEATWQAFWRTAVEGQPPRSVADSLKMSVGAVYIARSRVLARLKEEVQRLLEEENSNDDTHG